MGKFTFEAFQALVEWLQKERDKKNYWRVKLPKEVIKIIERAIETGLYKEVNNKLIWQYKGYELACMANEINAKYGIGCKRLYECSYHVRSGKIKQYANVYQLADRCRKQKTNRAIKTFIIKHINRNYNE